MKIQRENKDSQFFKSKSMEAGMTNHCGAKTRADGKCKKPSMANGRCRFHGGLSTGNPSAQNNQSALTHGIYSRRLASEEIELLPLVKIGSVEDELIMTRIMLRRALMAQNEIESRTDKLELDERIERDVAVNVGARTEVKYRRRDYHGIIDRLLGRIESLEKTRALLNASSRVIDADMSETDTFLAPDEPVPANPIL